MSRRAYLRTIIGCLTPIEEPEAAQISRRPAFLDMSFGGSHEADGFDGLIGPASYSIC